MFQKPAKLLKKSPNPMNTLTELKTEILVFSTSISNRDDLKLLEKILNPLSEVLAWNVDLEDWEKILRIEVQGISSLKISELLLNKGVIVRELS